jgi:hypothetical protein
MDSGAPRQPQQLRPEAVPGATGQAARLPARNRAGADHPIPGFGAVEEGGHVVRAPAPEGGERTASYRFVQLWRLAPEGWLLSKVYSLDHRMGPPAAP